MKSLENQSFVGFGFDHALGTIMLLYCWIYMPEDVQGSFLMTVQYMTGRVGAPGCAMWRLFCDRGLGQYTAC